MSDLERFWLGDDEYGDPALVPASDGHWVRFSDVAEREARFQARIEELEAGIRDVQNDLRQSRATLEDLRSLLDSGEERDCPDCPKCEGQGHLEEGPFNECDLCGGSGRATEEEK